METKILLGKEQKYEKISSFAWVICRRKNKKAKLSNFLEIPSTKWCSAYVTDLPMADSEEGEGGYFLYQNWRKFEWIGFSYQNFGPTKYELRTTKDEKLSAKNSKEYS